MWMVFVVSLYSAPRDVVAVSLNYQVAASRAAASLPMTCAKPPLIVDEKLFYTSRPAMGTSFEIYLYAVDRERATQLFDEAFDEIERLEALLSNYRDSSELSRINKRAAHEQVVTDPEMFHFLEQSLAWSRRTKGAFDITVGGLMRAWGFFRGRGSYRLTPSCSGYAHTRVGGMYI
jgi:thiamine biosynthesis lipoprotein